MSDYMWIKDGGFGTRVVLPRHISVETTLADGSTCAVRVRTCEVLALPEGYATLDALGYNRVVPLEREPFAQYETEWVKGDDLIYREVATAVTVDEDAALVSAKGMKQAEITSGADSVLKALAVEYPDMERATWDQQYQEAMAYTADPATNTPLLSAIAQGRGMTVSELATRVVNNRAAWVAASGAIVGQRLAYQDALYAATTVDEIESITVEYPLVMSSTVV